MMPNSFRKIPGRSTSAREPPFQRWSEWLGSISEHDAELLQLQPEYEEFLTAMRRLEQSHIKILNSPAMSSSITKSTRHSIPPLFLLQSSLLLRIFDFLECRDLVLSSLVSRRVYRITHETARIRTAVVKNAGQTQQQQQQQYQHPTPLQQVRIQEQWEGRSCTADYRVVPRPFLLLSRRVLVEQCGDDECNGVYLCTEACGNGFVFTQPRRRSCGSGSGSRAPVNQQQEHTGGVLATTPQSNDRSDLRCRIAKRFSGPRILWYMSKDEPDGSSTYLYWADLMQEEAGPRDLLQYPSISSVLGLSNQAWQPLPTAPNLQAPVVEIMDE